VLGDLTHGLNHAASTRARPACPDANKPGKAETLAQPGARAAVTDLAEITTAPHEPHEPEHCTGRW